MSNKIIIVFDCGATNVRSVAINALGKIEAMHSIPNTTQPDPHYKGGLIWDIDEIWQKFVTCYKNIQHKIDINRIGAITVTTFGVNGAPVNKEGNLLYPVISWQCQRTEPIMKNIGKCISLEQLYKISGVNEFSFNTINTLVWLKQNKPEILDEMVGWLFIPSIFIHKLTGVLVNDTTMAGTSMLTDLSKREISKEILQASGIPDKFFNIKEPGTIAGTLTKAVADNFGLPKKTPVVLAGHDTQFALIGSGAAANNVVLSSGTWEILMTRSKFTDTGIDSLNTGITNEFDAEIGLYNSGIQWLGSGVLEWIKRTFYSDLLNSNSDIYETMISEAEKIKNPGEISFSHNFINNAGIINGIGLHTQREQIYLAALQSLTAQTKQSLEFLEQVGKFKANSIILVGGGSKNRLWNKLRANMLKIPVKISEQTETTVLGASLFAQKAIGTFKTIDDAVEKTCRNYKIIDPE